MSDPRVNTLEKADRYVFLMDSLREIGVAVTFDVDGKAIFKNKLKQLMDSETLLSMIKQVTSSKSNDTIKMNAITDLVRMA